MKAKPASHYVVINAVDATGKPAGHPFRSGLGDKLSLSTMRLLNIARLLTFLLTYFAELL